MKKHLICSSRSTSPEGALYYLYPYIHRSPPAASKTTEQDNAFTGLNDPDSHPYEEIAMYRKTGETVPKCSAKEFTVSQCPAYSSLPKSACLPELEYDEVRTVTTHGQRVMSHMRTPNELVQGSGEINMA